MPAEVETMFYVREAPWHGLGVRVEEAPDSEVALVKAGLAWGVAQRPVYVDGRLVPDYQANVRATDSQVLGIVGSRYRVLQNREAFGFTDALLGEGVRYETAGSLAGGKRVWILARVGETVEILGDEVHPYLFFSNSHDGSAGVRVALTPVRVVCQNTLNLALRGVARAWSARHTASIHDRVEEAARTLGLFRHYLEGLATTAKDLAKRPLGDSDWNEFIKTLFPAPEDATERVRENVNWKRELLQQAYQAPDLDAFRGTLWGALGAVVDYADHAPPLRQSEGWEENRFARVVDGDPLVDRALALLAA